MFLAADQAAQQGQAARLILEGMLEEVEVGDAHVRLLQLGRLGVSRTGIQRHQRHLRLGAQNGLDVEGGGGTRRLGQARQRWRLLQIGGVDLGTQPVHVARPGGQQADRVGMDQRQGDQEAAVVDRQLADGGRDRQRPVAQILEQGGGARVVATHAGACAGQKGGGAQQKGATARLEVHHPAHPQKSQLTPNQ
ncbi:hypothetical protein D3C86_1598830 [compost metagenome]